MNIAEDIFQSYHLKLKDLISKETPEWQLGWLQRELLMKLKTIKGIAKETILHYNNKWSKLRNNL